ncbi:MAG TPA: metal-sensitive transcriptional regulator [Amycolatopsis sp.]|uniref:metal-sensitive transcriptional regulator n=1 Tax=Amycolatopsis sp. TaxID=37632 RepID=UPI002B46B9EC|nr:metal-sensitive transcriptional regulator [Amycolatopsis sp.]HKS43688.1 metal-sensitive transcriptional regulator [Amycolatopsis sp.]
MTTKFPRQRLRRAAGQILGIERMLTEDRSCEDELIQIAAPSPQTGARPTEHRIAPDADP